MNMKGKRKKPDYYYLDTTQARGWREKEHRLNIMAVVLFLMALLVAVLFQTFQYVTDRLDGGGYILNVVVSFLIIFFSVAIAYYFIKRLFLKMHMSEKQLLTIADVSTDAVFLVDRDFVIRAWSRGAELVFGYPEEEVVGKNVSVLFPPHVPHEDTNFIATLADGGTVDQYRTLRRRKDGDIFPAEISVSVLKMPDGEIFGALTVLRDITRQVEMEEELLRINAELNGYAHMVSHDLKAPISNIRIASDTLRTLLEKHDIDELDPNVVEVLQTMDDSIEESTSLIYDLLTLAEAGQRPKETSSVDVRRIVDRAASELKGQIEERGILLECDEDLGHVHGSPTHIYQLFSNLLTNAINHNDGNSPVVEIRCLESDGFGAHRYLFRDNGPGIPVDDPDKIFTPFFKGEGGGSGLGLSTVKKIIEVYDGEIEAYNDGGACFEFSICDLPGDGD